MSERDLFLAALGKPPAERAAFLDGACADAPALRRRIEALLGAHAQGGGLLGGPHAGETSAAGDPGPSIPETIGDGPPAPAVDPTAPTSPGRPSTSPRAAPRTRPRTARSARGPARGSAPTSSSSRSARGGWASSSWPSRSSPVRRRVALKVIKAGMDTGQVVARFEAERQALAMMDHPNIARVLDAGATETGRPYFVMELVKGIPITEYCDQAHLTPRERLALFVRRLPRHPARATRRG